MVIYIYIYRERESYEHLPLGFDKKTTEAIQTIEPLKIAAVQRKEWF
jgi:hypothetical protein